MLNVQNEYVNGNIAPKISTEKVNPNISAHKPGNTENTVVNRDTFEYTVSENLSIYSPELINRMENTSNVLSVTSDTRTATNDLQRRNIALLLAAKMAHISSNDTGPIINGAYEAQQYSKAVSIIKGDHKKLAYKSEYCYSQTRDSFSGIEYPRSACATYAFATALSIKNGRKITPDQVASGPSNEGSFSKDNVKTWNWGGETTYRIRYNNENDLFLL